MSKVFLLSAAAALGLGLLPVLSAQTTDRPLTQEELLKRIEELGKGNPVTKTPLNTAKAPPPKAEPRLKPSTVPGKPFEEPPLPKSDAPTMPAGASSPAPKAKKPKILDNGEPAPPGETIITSEEGTFEQATHTAIFSKNVFVKNPDFTVSCEKLTAYLKHDDAKPGAKERKGQPNNRPPAPGATPAPAAVKATPGRLSVPVVESGGAKVTAPAGKADAAADKPGGLDKAVAEINVEIIQDKIDENGNPTRNVGHGKKAVYDSNTGDVTLTGNPDVQQGINTCVSLSEDTIIILNRDGHMRTLGPTKNTIRESGDTGKKDKDKPAAATPHGR